MKRYAKLLGRYLMRAGFARDLGELAGSRRGDPVDLLFVCTAPVDEQWIRTTATECRRRGVRCATVLASFRSHTAAERRLFDYHLSPLAVRALRSEVLVTPSTGFPRWLRPRGRPLFVHMPHSLVSLLGVYFEGTFDRYDAFLCCGPHHIEEVAAMDELAGRPKRRTFAAGYGKMDLLLRQRERAVERQAAAGARPVVLVAPSWGADNILEAIGLELVEALLREGYRVVVRPHPMAFVERPDLMGSMRDRFSDSDRFTLEDPTEEPVAMLTASVVISDHSGVAFEYAFLCERPVLFVDVPARNLNPNWRQFGLDMIEAAGREKAGLIVPPAVADVLAGVRRLLDEADGWRSRILRIRDDYLFNPTGCAGPATDAIGELLASRRSPR